MTLVLFLKKIRQWFTMFITVVVVATLGIFIYLMQNANLTSAMSAVYVKSSDSDVKYADTGINVSYAQSQINNIQVFAKSSQVLVPVINKHNLHITIEGFLQKYLNVSVPNKTTSIQISVKYSDSRVASDIANDIATNVVNLVNSKDYFRSSEAKDSDTTANDAKQDDESNAKTLTAEVIQYSTSADQSLFDTAFRIINKLLIALAVAVLISLLLIMMRLLLEITQSDYDTPIESRRITSANYSGRRKL